LIKIWSKPTVLALFGERHHGCLGPNMERTNRICPQIYWFAYIAYRPQMTEWDGMSTLQLSLKDIQVA